MSVIGRVRYGHYDVLIAGEVGPYLAYIAFGKSNLVYGSAVFVSGKRGVAVNGEDKVFKVFVYRLFIDVVAKSLRVVFGNNKKLQMHLLHVKACVIWNKFDVRRRRLAVDYCLNIIFCLLFRHGSFKNSAGKKFVRLIENLFRTIE